jgi:hypothetical protein
MMSKEDKAKLRELMRNYPAKAVMGELSKIALEVAGEVSDDGHSDLAKEYVRFSVALDDVISGRPFLV